MDMLLGAPEALTAAPGFILQYFYSPVHLLRSHMENYTNWMSLVKTIQKILTSLPL
jgi:hypothetical protein